MLRIASSLFLISTIGCATGPDNDRDREKADADREPSAHLAAIRACDEAYPVDRIDIQTKTDPASAHQRCVSAANDAAAAVIDEIRAESAAETPAAPAFAAFDERTAALCSLLVETQPKGSSIGVRCADRRESNLAAVIDAYVEFEVELARPPVVRPADRFPACDQAFASAMEAITTLGEEQGALIALADCMISTARRTAEPRLIEQLVAAGATRDAAAERIGDTLTALVKNARPTCELLVDAHRSHRSQFLNNDVDYCIRDIATIVADLTMGS